MYDSLKVLCFLAFQTFEMSALTRVNLLVGKNNAGKTSLLDAVEMLALGGRAASLLKSPGRRTELSLDSADERVRPDLDLRHLFYGHRIDEGSWFGVVARTQSAERTVRCEVRRASGDSGPEQPDLFPLDESVDLGPPLELFLTGPDNPEGTSGLSVSATGSLLDYRRRTMVGVPGARSGASAAVSFLGTEGADPRDLREAWDRLVLLPEEERVIAAMRIIEPTIERLAFTSNRQLSEPIGFVKLAGEDRRMPLGSLGDGIRRLLSQAIYLARAAGGVLLIDEIDTGLHYSTMESMWRFVVETARRLDVQVFATSHSGDCIRALAWLQTDTPELAADISVHRIDRTAPAAVRYSAEEIEIAARHHVEVRG